MRAKTDLKSSEFFDNVKRIIASIQAKKERELNLGGSIKQLENMFGVSIFADDLRRDEYICGALVPRSLSNKIDKDEKAEGDPANFISFKHDITVYEDEGLDPEHMIVFTPDRFIFAAAK